MKYFTLIGLFALFAAFAVSAQDGHTMPHEMQHGFILAKGDTFASHLVANGHHSRQVEIIGRLDIRDGKVRNMYLHTREADVEGKYYFLFQAQKLDLPTLQEGQVLTGHIVQSQVGLYEPKNTIVPEATFTVERVLLNVVNPFFGE